MDGPDKALQSRYGLEYQLMPSICRDGQPEWRQDIKLSLARSCHGFGHVSRCAPDRIS